jgi:predicted lipid-binding transport protein (Tim44 family)
VKRTIRLVGLCSSVVLLSSAWTTVAQSADEGSSTVRQHAEQSFQEMKQTERSGKPKSSAGAGTTVTDGSGSYSSDQYLIGKGQGDLSKGKSVCQRVSELSARTDLAKQIRVMVKEHMVDRVRERAGKDTEQDIELTREEIVQEYLQGVKIVDRQIDEENKTCSAVAVMPKSQIAPRPAPDQPEPVSTIIR